MSMRATRSFDDDVPMGEDPQHSSSRRERRTLSLDTLDVGATVSADDESEDLKYATSDDSSLAGAGGDSEQDQELRVAKEMALAIQQNPHLTPGELKELMAKTQARISGVPAATTTPMKTTPPPASSSGKGKSPLLKSIGKGVKSQVKKAFKPSTSNSNISAATTTTPDRTSSGSNSPTLTANAAAASSLSSSGNAAATTPNRITSAGIGGGGMKLGDFLESTGRSNSQDQDDDLGTTTATLAGNNDSIRITGIIWKRRSGLGKYSTTAAWERRRVVLKGSKLYYYRTNVDKRDEQDGASGDDDDDEGGNQPSGHFSADSGHSPPPRSKSWFTEMTSGSHTKPTKKDARGYLDLVKENASVGASFGHSGAPTPFSLSIKILTQTKWKLCFDTHGELMQWLAAMTDVIVQGSVDTYNSQILAANDPSNRSTIGDYASHGQLSEPPLIANSGTASQVGGHRLWVTGHYKIQSENYPAELDDIEEEDLDADVDSDDDGATAPHVQSRDFSAVNSDDLVLALDGGRDVWGVPAQYIWHWGLLWNVVILLARASSTTVESFWYLITFANIALFGFMTKDTVGGTVKANAITSHQKMVRRLSSGMGISIAASEKVLAQKERSVKDLSARAEIPVGAVKPKAGTTTMRIENATDLPVNKDGHVFAGWRWAKPSNMLVRSHNYKKDKIKVPSPGELYKCVHVDIFESRNRFPDMSSRVQLPKVEFQDDGPKTWNAPDIFVVSIAIPTDPPKLYNSTEDGGGYTITWYFVMHQETRDILKRVTADGYSPQNEKFEDINKSKVNAVRLLDEWCRRAPTDDAFCARFKVLPNAQNLKEIGLPSWIAKYNGKPFLIKRPGQTGFLYRHPDKSCVEFDISLHPFPYLAKQGICFMKDSYFKKVLVTFGFLIEGRAEDELPECLIGLNQICYPDPIHAIQGEGFMAGTSPKSFE